TRRILAVKHVLDGADQFVTVAWFLFDQRQQQQLQVAVAEHAAAAAATAAVQAVPVGEGSEIVMVMASAPERAAAGETGIGIAVVAVPIERVVSMHGMELVVQFLVQVHGWSSLLESVFKIYLNNVEINRAPRTRAATGIRCSPSFLGGTLSPHSADETNVDCPVRWGSPKPAHPTCAVRTRMATSGTRRSVRARWAHSSRPRSRGPARAACQPDR